MPDVLFGGTLGIVPVLDQQDAHVKKRLPTIGLAFQCRLELGQGLSGPLPKLDEKIE